MPNMMRSQLMDDEDKKKKEELIKLFFKEKVRRENGNARLNEIKVNQKWRALLREGKTAEMRAAIDVMQETFQSVLRHKDQLITYLQQDYDEASRQHSRLFASHLQSLEEMIEAKSKRAEYVRDNFLSKLSETIRKYDEEYQKLDQDHQQDMDKLLQCDVKEEKAFKEIKDRTTVQFLNLEEDLVENDLEEKQVLQTNMERKIQMLWQKLQDALQTYMSKTGDRNQAYQDLQIKSKANSNQITAQQKEIQRLNDAINSLRYAIAQTEGAYKEINTQLKQEKAALQESANAMKRQIHQTEQSERASLSRLVSQSDRVLETLRAHCQTANRIQRLESNWKRYEDEEITFDLSEKEITYLQSTDLPKEFLTENGNLENFWRRYNEVELQNVFLQKELSQLTEDNKKLKKMTKDKILHWNNGELFKDSTVEHLHHINLGKPTVLNAAELLNRLR